MKKISKIFAIVLAAVIVVSAFAGCSLLSPSKKLVGTWLDSTGLHGYEFKEDGKVTLIAFDASKISILGGIVDSLLGENAGNIDGVYSVEKGEDGNMYVKLSYTVGAKTMEVQYKYTVNESSLTLTEVVDGADGNSTTYIKQAASAETTAAQQ